MDNATSSRYIKRLDGSLSEKLALLEFVPDKAKIVLDVGCAAGHVTHEMAERRPQTVFHGIDLDRTFINEADSLKWEKVTMNTMFDVMYLRDLLKETTRYDAVIFGSVLHEFYSYGEGLTSIVKALSDAVELLKPGGRLIIRDMMRENENEQRELVPFLSTLRGQLVHDYPAYVRDFENKRSVDVGTNVIAMNDLLLKLMYIDNWSNEIQENYFPMSRRQYDTFLGRILGLYQMESYSKLSIFIQDRWRKEFNFTDEANALFRSIGVVVYKKAW